MSDVDEYIAKIDEPQKAELIRLRKIIKQTVPDAIEVMSYGIPGFKYKNKYLLGYAAFKDHMSFFPTSHPVEKLKDKLSGYKLSTGTIQFTVDNPIPESVIKELVTIRLKDING